MSTQWPNKKILIINGKKYRVTGFPSIIQDLYSDVEVFVSQSKNKSTPLSTFRKEHWRKITSSKTKNKIWDHCCRLIQAEIYLEEQYGNIIYNKEDR